jgi:hypothetical protein
MPFISFEHSLSVLGYQNHLISPYILIGVPILLFLLTIIEFIFNKPMLNKIGTGVAFFYLVFIVFKILQVLAKILINIK